jgi:DNA repair exonuclease SbcCD ATPase subunit
LVLEAEWEDKARSFVWFLRDGTNRTVLQKASGFQRFIVGMAMRIAMSRLGICRAEYKQFFIDEGFTACDGENLEKAPAFLRSLLEGGSGLTSGQASGTQASGAPAFVKGYSSVVLATHLEELKTCGDVQVGIVRDALSGVARVAVGTVRTAPSVPADKAKRGRPKKAPASEAKSDAKGEAKTCV